MVGRQLGLGDKVKFLDAYQWMGESESNICARSKSDLRYRVLGVELQLYSEHCDDWVAASIDIQTVLNDTWKVILEKKTIILNEYLIFNGKHYSILESSEIGLKLYEGEDWSVTKLSSREIKI